MDHKSNSFLETEKIGVLMRKYAIPMVAANKGTFIYLQPVGKAVASTVISLIR